MIESLQTRAPRAPSPLQDAMLPGNTNLPSIHLLLEKMMAHSQELYAISKKVESLLRSNQIELNGASYRQKLAAADKAYEAARDRAICGMGAGVIGMGSGIFGTYMSTGSKAMIETGKQMGPGLQSAADFMKQAGAAATADMDRQSQQLMARAEYQSKLADQCQVEMREAQDEARQRLQDCQRLTQNLVDLHNQVGNAIKLA